MIPLQSIFNCYGFSYLAPLRNCAPNSRTTSRSSGCVSPFATTQYNDGDNKKTNDRIVDYNPIHTAAGVSATLALAWAIMGAATPSNAYESSVSSSVTSSSVQLGKSYSESDFADFSLPSYQDVTAAEVNSNLKGDKDLLGEKFKEAR